MPDLLPEQRDVDAAYRMAMADYADFTRCKRDFGPASPETKAAWRAYDASWTHFKETKRLFQGAQDEPPTCGGMTEEA